MTEERKNKLRRILAALKDLPEFTARQIQERCPEVPAAYITRTLNDLIREGALIPLRREGKSPRLYSARDGNFDAETWIDRRVHGEQVTQSPESERPRERLLEMGASALSNADLLAILIRVGRPGESAIQSGRKLANRFATCLDKLPQTSCAELRDVSPVVTKVSYAQIMAGIELGRRVAEAIHASGPKEFAILNPEQAMEYCCREFARLAYDARQEEFHIVTLDIKHKPIATHCISVGTLDASLVHPREVFRAAIRDAAAAILLVHNHPSGDPTPSREDRDVSRKLVEAGKLLGIKVLDHIVVARGEARSAL